METARNMDTLLSTGILEELERTNYIRSTAFQLIFTNT